MRIVACTALGYDRPQNQRQEQARGPPHDVAQMTALSEYERLETIGLWREAAGGQRRGVIVSFGEATLVIADERTGRALAHWSLPAVERRNPGIMPAILVPGGDAQEELEIDDPAMIAAITKVHTLIEARKPHPGRLRLAVFLVLLAAVVGAGLFWVPGAVIAHTIRVVPPETRLDIGRRLLADVFRVSGAACAAPEGREALARLSARLGGGAGGPGGSLIVLASGLSGTRHLPGGTILIGRDLVEQEIQPEVLAGHVLAERARAGADDPLAALLHWTGVRSAFALLTTGEIPADNLVGYAEALLTGPVTPPPLSPLLEAFAAAGVPAAPYAARAGLDGTMTGALVAGDPFRAPAAPPEPVLSDTDWVALQGICGG